MIDNVEKAQFLLLFYWVHYAYMLRGFPVFASDNQIVVKGKCVSNTSENSLSDVIFLIYNELCALLHTAFVETDVLES
jgi:hypothetical protein